MRVHTGSSYIQDIYVRRRRCFLEVCLHFHVCRLGFETCFRLVSSARKAKKRGMVYGFSLSRNLRSLRIASESGSRSRRLILAQPGAAAIFGFVLMRHPSRSPLCSTSMKKILSLSRFPVCPHPSRMTSRSGTRNARGNATTRSRSSGKNCKRMARLGRPSAIAKSPSGASGCNTISQGAAEDAG